MAAALLSVGLLGLLVFILGMNVSRERSSVIITQGEAEADPTSGLRKAIRAHGNCCEYVPMLTLMILALGLRTPITPYWMIILMLSSVLFRYIHAGGVLMGNNIYAPNIGKFVGAAGTYLTGTIMAVLLIVKAAALF